METTKVVWTHVCVIQASLFLLLMGVFYYRPQRSWAKVIFSQACVCPQGGVCLSACWDTPPPPRSRSRPHPPGSRHPRMEADPPGSRHLPEGRPPGADTPPEGRLQHTVYERPVRILLECILVIG